MKAAYEDNFVTAYWGLRSYLADDHESKKSELGLERTPEEYVERMVKYFRQVKRLLRKDGTLWLNLGDSYATSAGAVGRCPGGGDTGDIRKGPVLETKTVGWQPSCKCGVEPEPCVVLDPFAESGTTGQVARETGRKAILIELNPDDINLLTTHRFKQELLQL